MSSEEIAFECYGPFVFTGNLDNNIFTNSIALKKGVYLWTIPFEDKYLVYYVGQTGVSFVYRSLQHIQNYLNGFYRVFDSTEFERGNKILIWGGMWKRDRQNPKFIVDFLQKHFELAPEILRFIDLFRVFLVPINRDNRFIERVEAAIAKMLYQQPGIVGTFQDSDVVYRKRRADEQVINVKVNFPKDILGLNEDLLI